MPRAVERVIIKLGLAEGGGDDILFCRLSYDQLNFGVGAGPLLVLKKYAVLLYVGGNPDPETVDHHKYSVSCVYKDRDGDNVLITSEAIVKSALMESIENGTLKILSYVKPKEVKIAQVEAPDVVESFTQTQPASETSNVKEIIRSQAKFIRRKFKRAVKALPRDTKKGIKEVEQAVESFANVVVSSLLNLGKESDEDEDEKEKESKETESEDSKPSAKVSNGSTKHETPDESSKDVHQEDRAPMEELKKAKLDVVGTHAKVPETQTEAEESTDESADALHEFIEAKSQAIEARAKVAEARAKIENMMKSPPSATRSVNVDEDVTVTPKVDAVAVSKEEQLVSEVKSDSSDETPETKAEEEAYLSRPFIHGRHTCDGCLTTPIIGKRYHAVNLPDYDLCSNCRHNYKGEHIKFVEDELDRDRPAQDRWHRRYAKWGPSLRNKARRHMHPRRHWGLGDSSPTASQNPVDTFFPPPPCNAPYRPPHHGHPPFHHPPYHHGQPPPPPHHVPPFHGQPPFPPHANGNAPFPFGAVSNPASEAFSPEDLALKEALRRSLEPDSDGPANGMQPSPSDEMKKEVGLDIDEPTKGEPKAESIHELERSGDSNDSGSKKEECVAVEDESKASVSKHEDKQGEDVQVERASEPKVEHALIDAKVVPMESLPEPSVESMVIEPSSVKAVESESMEGDFYGTKVVMSRNSSPAKSTTSFHSQAEGCGDVAAELGLTLDKFAKSIDDMMNFDTDEVAEESHPVEVKETIVEDANSAGVVVDSKPAASKSKVSVSDDASERGSEEEETKSISSTGVKIVDGDEDKQDDESKSSWEVVANDDQVNDEELARAAEVLGSALFNSDLARSEEQPVSTSTLSHSSESKVSSASESNVSSVSSVPSTVPSLTPESQLPAAQIVRWAPQLRQLRELGFVNDALCVDVLERLSAANIGVDSTDEVTVEQVVDALLQEW